MALPTRRGLRALRCKFGYSEAISLNNTPSHCLSTGAVIQTSKAVKDFRDDKRKLVQSASGSEPLIGPNPFNQTRLTRLKGEQVGAVPTGH